MRTKNRRQEILVEQKRNNNRHPLCYINSDGFLDPMITTRISERKKRKKEKAHHAHEGEEESTVTSKRFGRARGSYPLIVLLSSSQLGPSVPSINKSTAKNGTVVAIKPRYGTRCSAGTISTREKEREREKGETTGRKKENLGGGLWSCQFNLSREEEERDSWKLIYRYSFIFYRYWRGNFSFSFEQINLNLDNWDSRIFNL